MPLLPLSSRLRIDRLIEFFNAQSTSQAVVRNALPTLKPLSFQ
ncbi:hypothetical protein PAMC26510_37485 [Caballeronia sordidicola]|uniref:Uncharacterized protein n=1 Tax=Caballeronia sordidicola TaxID=196367 RepID=A0A242M416_CABSO|nr:hypothetical protein PAMC26510_37485 [Caballeronia sordidicola]